MKSYFRCWVLAVWIVNGFLAIPVSGQEAKTKKKASTPMGRLEWSAPFPNLGSFSSPRVADLNGDGIGDIILGISRLEFQAIDKAVVALGQMAVFYGMCRPMIKSLAQPCFMTSTKMVLKMSSSREDRRI